MCAKSHTRLAISGYWGSLRRVSALSRKRRRMCTVWRAGESSMKSCVSLAACFWVILGGSSLAVDCQSAGGHIDGQPADRRPPRRAAGRQAQPHGRLRPVERAVLHAAGAWPVLQGRERPTTGHRDRQRQHAPGIDCRCDEPEGIGWPFLRLRSCRGISGALTGGDRHRHDLPHRRVEPISVAASREGLPSRCVHMTKSLDYVTLGAASAGMTEEEDVP